MSQTSRDRVNSRRVRTHEKNSGDAVRRLGTIIQSIFCAQSGAGIRLNFWKWSGESRYPGALSPVMKTFVPPLLPTRPTAPGSPQPRSQGSLLPALSRSLRGAGKREPWERGLGLRGCTRKCSNSSLSLALNSACHESDPY